jgi:hypothetical protein
MQIIIEIMSHCLFGKKLLSTVKDHHHLQSWLIMTLPRLGYAQSSNATAMLTSSTLTTMMPATPDSAALTCS